jgi:hypothetical protein
MLQYRIRILYFVHELNRHFTQTADIEATISEDVSTLKLSTTQI